MAAENSNRNKIIFRYVYYATTIAGLIASAVVLYYAYNYLNISKYIWFAAFASVVIYLAAALIFVRRKSGFDKFVSHTILLQLIPICATIILACVVSTRKNYKPLVGRVNEYERAFNDLQAVQKRSALKNGVKPIVSRSELKNCRHGLLDDDRLVEITSNSDYVVRPLTYSVPYVVPKVRDFLDDLAEAFQQETETKAKFEVTSVLRTDEDVAKLREVNGNASADSCHRYGTTLDISYVHFKDDVFKPRTTHELRLALSKALHRLRESGRCYVKMEKKQCCYHITIR